MAHLMHYHTFCRTVNLFYSSRRESLINAPFSCLYTRTNISKFSFPLPTAGGKVEKGKTSRKCFFCFFFLIWVDILQPQKKENLPQNLNNTVEITTISTHFFQLWMAALCANFPSSNYCSRVFTSNLSPSQHFDEERWWKGAIFSNVK